MKAHFDARTQKEKPESKHEKRGWRFLSTGGGALVTFQSWRTDKTVNISVHAIPPSRFPAPRPYTTQNPNRTLWYHVCKTPRLKVEVFFNTCIGLPARVHPSSLPLSDFFSFGPCLVHREALLRLHQLLAPATRPLVAGPECLRSREALQGFVEGPNLILSAVDGVHLLQIHGEVHEGVECVAAVAAFRALELPHTNEPTHTHARKQASKRARTSTRPIFVSSCDRSA